jgi:hypothetical protein
VFYEIWTLHDFGAVRSPPCFREAPSTKPASPPDQHTVEFTGRGEILKPPPIGRFVRFLRRAIFFGGAGLFWSDYVYSTAVNANNSMDPASYTGWYAFIWAVFFCYVWLGSFKSGITRMLFLLGLWLTLLALAIGNWGNLHSIILIGGYLGLVTSILAAITSAIDIITFGMKRGDPNHELAAAA